MNTNLYRTKNRTNKKKKIRRVATLTEDKPPNAHKTYLIFANLYPPILKNVEKN